MPAVKMYTTAICPYCVRAKQILQSKGVAHIEEVRVDLNPDERVKMMEITGRRSVPQIFIGDTHVGGCDDLMALDSQGGLMPLLQARTEIIQPIPIYRPIRCSPKRAFL